jgi:putative ATPase
MSMELFQKTGNDIQRKDMPLAMRMCPKELSEFTGQEHILGAGKLLRRIIEADRIASLIFYGPPGCGKSALANIIAKKTKAYFAEINAVSSGIAQIHREVSNALDRKNISGQKTVLLVDEIHHFNTGQQDTLLPDVERGVVQMIGITTENPYYYVNSALISRSQVFQFKPLIEADIKAIVIRALNDRDNGFGKTDIILDDDALTHLTRISNGDARRALNALELGVMTTESDAKSGKIHFDIKTAEESIQKKTVLYDKKSDEHYNTISAFIKSMRGSDPDAALYWLAKMLHAGEDPRFIARRIVICAAEDVGNADPQALVIANAALQVSEFTGMPEARIPLAQATVYIAAAPKSNAAYMGINDALNDIENKKLLEIPAHLTKAGEKNYKYPHDYPEGYVEQEYLPEKRKYYFPKDIGFEKKIKEWIESLQNEKRAKK